MSHDQIESISKTLYHDLNCVSEFVQKVDYFYGKTLQAILDGDPDEAEKQSTFLATYAQMMSRRVRWASVGLNRIEYCDKDQIQFDQDVWVEGYQEV